MRFSKHLLAIALLTPSVGLAQVSVTPTTPRTPGPGPTTRALMEVHAKAAAIRLSIPGPLPTPPRDATVAGLTFPAVPWPLFGSEGVTRASYVEAIRTGEIGDPFPMLRETLDMAEQAAEGLTRSSTFTVVRGMLEWLEMRRDWVRALAVGDGPRATEIAEMSREAFERMQRDRNAPVRDMNGSLYPGWGIDEIRWCSETQSLLLLAAADAASHEAAYLSIRLDPEGYLRQNLRYAAPASRQQAAAVLSAAAAAAPWAGSHAVFVP